MTNHTSLNKERGDTINEILNFKNSLEDRYDLKIFTDNVEFECLEQTKQLLEQEPFKDCKIRLMPDTHAGKGAISAYKDEVVIIPMNMRDGSLICVGKGNDDWNNSAPSWCRKIDV